MKFKTLAIDSGSELARLVFSWEMKKHTGDFETIRKMNNYPGMTERFNMISRRLIDYRDSYGLTVVILCHEGIDKIYAKKSGMDVDPTAVKGRIDIPGNTSPEEIMRAGDNIFRVRIVNGNPTWIANSEVIPGSDGACWQVKDRFNATAIQSGLLPPSYSDIERLAKANPKCTWTGPYIWIIYGGVGFKKTRSLLTFPKPIKILDVDRGTSVIQSELGPEDVVVKFSSEECDDYPRFMVEMESTIEDPAALARAKQKLGIK